MYFMYIETYCEELAYIIMVTKSHGAEPSAN